VPVGSAFACDRPKDRFVGSLYEMKRRMFMTFCNKKIDLP
jgi:hypothetical protein